MLPYCLVRKQMINNKLQGSVATYSTYGGIVNNHIKTADSGSEIF